jgi:hemoglobin
MKAAALGLIAVLAAAPALAQEPWAVPGEEPVAPYTPSAANAGATPFEGTAMFEAFHGREGIARIVAGLLDQSFADPRSSDIFKAHDRVRLERTLNEQFCYILGGGCAYTGRDMKTTHKDMGLQVSDMNILVEHLQIAMDKEGVPFATQNRFLAKLAPMKRDAVER